MKADFLYVELTRRVCIGWKAHHSLSWPLVFTSVPTKLTILAPKKLTLLQFGPGQLRASSLLSCMVL
ncbi:hypothetical protein FRX31_032665 [Thalictrum thalictroides]|uniref:Uncharacterized protein n=1 Tax=Thalictrum thalictroides TaxID=46969 RepID=A0A7J6UYQ6_THATH|nr:hypothetical protein FRX31_032665 [Thalictrum thalictroides]